MPNYINRFLMKSSYKQKDDELRVNTFDVDLHLLKNDLLL